MFGKNTGGSQLTVAVSVLNTNADADSPESPQKINLTKKIWSLVFSQSYCIYKIFYLQY